MSKNKQKPEWTPKEHGEEFASNVIKGVEGGHDGLPDIHGKNPGAPKSNQRRSLLTIEDFVHGILKRERTILGRASTLVESNSPDHLRQAQEVLKHLLPYTGNSIRIGITGVPGSGKSTLIEALGLYLIAKGHQVAGKLCWSVKPPDLM
jgi:LAO/AO transport system kinase